MLHINNLRLEYRRYLIITIDPDQTSIWNHIKLKLFPKLPQFGPVLINKNRGNNLIIQINSLLISFQLDLVVSQVLHANGSKIVWAFVQGRWVQSQTELMLYFLYYLWVCAAYCCFHLGDSCVAEDWEYFWQFW